MSVAVADSSVLIAAADRSDRSHRQCARAVREHLRSGIVVPATVAVEVDDLLRSRLGAYAARTFLQDVNSGRYLLEPVDADLFGRGIEIDSQYADLDVGVIDGTVVAAAERWSAEAILSLDDHYRVIAPKIEMRPVADDRSSE